ncbi:MAG TPA: hypothetical protein VN797_03260 [Gemmatimonadaceae bacterium]|nr:hypothetical protein [Gemmatimonadaceae bacterium]
MFIELIDLLRCVNEHDDTWLVASFTQITNRFVMEGTLGCPICSAEYPIRDGIADFTLGESIPACEDERAAAEHGREELATRAGAYLDATQPGATIVLGGLWAYAAQQLGEIAEVKVIALNAPSEVTVSERVGLVRAAKRIPLAANSVHGAALDAWFQRPIVADAARVVRPGGRIVGAADFDRPQSAAVLAHDENYWVAEKAAEVIALRRGKASE